MKVAASGKWTDQSHPVVGKLVYSPYGDAEDGEGLFGQFRLVNDRLHGLVRVVKTRHARLDILAVMAKRPGRGEFTKFLREAKGAYRRIRIYAVINSKFGDYLLKQGFLPVKVQVGKFEEMALEWRKGKHQCTTT